MNLGARLLLVIILSLVPALAVQIWNELDLRKDSLEQLGREALKQAQLIASDQDEIIQAARHLMIALDHALSRQAVSCGALVQALEPEYDRYALIAVSGRNGEVICASSSIDVGSAVSLVHSQAAGQIETGSDLVIGEYTVWNGKSVLPLLHPLRQAKDVHGSVLVLLDLNWLELRLKERARAGRDVYLLADRNAKILARAPTLSADLPRISTAALAAITQHTHEGIVELDGADGVRRIYGFVSTETRPEGIFVVAGLDKAAALVAIDRASFRGLSLILGGLLTAVALSLMGLKRTLLQPIRLLCQAILDEPGRVARLDLGTATPELRDLGEALTRMTQIIADREHELRLACQKAEQASRLKNHLLAAAGHDLRQPLNAIALTQQMLRSNPETVRKEQLYALADRSVRKLERSLDTLLEASRLESGLVHPRPEPFPLRGLFEEIREEWQLSAAEKGLRFAVRSPVYRVHTDRDMLGTILANLVSNAIRYTDQGGILVGCHRRGLQVQIAVYDTGMGIPAEAMEQVFLEYTQLNAEAEQGFGLGLSIVRRTADLLRHRIEVLSRAGRGSRFSIFVPLAGIAMVRSAAEVITVRPGTADLPAGKRTPAQL